MLGLVKALSSKDGLSRDILDYEEEKLIVSMLRAGIVSEKNVNGEMVYKLEKNVVVTKEKGKILFEVVPKSYLGLFFEYDDIFECGKGKNEPDNYYVLYSFNPTGEDVKNFDLGCQVKVKVLAKGSNKDNEGLLVRLPGREEELYSMKNKACITIGLSDDGRHRDTSKLDFNEEISNKFIVGKRGVWIDNEVYYDVENVRAISNVYCLTKGNGRYKLEKTGLKKIYNRN